MNRDDTTAEAPTIAVQQAYWDQRWQKQSEPNDWQAKRSETVLAIARELPLDEPTILDLGCGTGFTTKALSELGDAEGVDLSPAAIRIAKTMYPGISFRAGDVYELAFADVAFDLVVCQEVIPHVTNQSRLINIIAAATKPGGYLIMTAANKFVMARLKGGGGSPVGTGQLDPAEHITQWLSLKQLSRLMQRQFDILKSTSILMVGNEGILRLINSYKVNQVLGIMFSPQRLVSFKERLGWGYTLIVVGQKRASFS